jgi:protein-L-isoaspartate(D-aspartate) O-methyltransferase
MIELALRRRFYAEEIEAVAKLRSAALVEALAAVPREHFLRAGPWTVLAEADFTGAGPARTRETPDADPARVYHNIAVAIDSARMLFNGAPGVIAGAIDALALVPGDRVLHIGTGLGYYTAVMAHIAGPAGRVLAFEADPALAEDARANLSSTPWVEVRAESAAGALDETFDAILINAGVTHPLDAWPDALARNGRMILPMTASMPAMGPDRQRLRVSSRGRRRLRGAAERLRRDLLGPRDPRGKRFNAALGEDDDVGSPARTGGHAFSL